jgi:hypothetical protein
VALGHAYPSFLWARCRTGVQYLTAQKEDITAVRKAYTLDLAVRHFIGRSRYPIA